MACFKIAALQKVLDSSVPLSELEVANKQYNALTAKYREMLQKDNLLVQRTTNMEHMEVMFVLHFNPKGKKWADRNTFPFGSLFVCLLFKPSFEYVLSEIIFSSLITKMGQAGGMFAIIFSSGGHKESRMNVNNLKAYS